MRRNLIAVLLTLIGTAGARAGIYSTAETPIGPDASEKIVRPLPLDLFRGALGNRQDLELIAPLNEQNQAKRKDYLAKAEALRAKVRDGSATPADQVNLSAYLIWLSDKQQNPDGIYLREAIELLEPLARGEQRGNFMVLANLATACQLAGQAERVPDYIQQALDNWPDEAPGFSKEQLKWLRQVEKYQQRLVLLRRAEAAKQPPGVRRAAEGVDPLFGPVGSPVRFVGEGGQYEAGKLAAAERAKLPPDAVAIVQQLLLWMPGDTRFYWLLGELLNADGQVTEAAGVLDDCVYKRRYDAAELKEHRRILQAAIPKPPPPAETVSTGFDVRRMYLVAGAAGLVIAVLGYFQFREMRRRRG